MFTGIVEGVARIVELGREDGSAVLCLEAGELARGVKTGDSIALDGCCLTVTRVEGERLWFQAVPETLDRTSIGARKAGEFLNVERALVAGGRFDGHIVQGHVDGTGVVLELSRAGSDVRMTVSCPPEIGDLLVPKGSIAIDGVALTLIEPTAEQFSVALIPHTLAVTTLGQRKPGDKVNLEADVLGKYVRHYLDRLTG